MRAAVLQTTFIQAHDFHSVSVCYDYSVYVCAMSYFDYINAFAFSADSSGGNYEYI